LGKGLTETLREDHELILHDLTPYDIDLPFFQGDAQIGWNLNEAAEGCDVIIHTPAYHLPHRRFRGELDFWRLNVDSLFYAFEAAVAKEVPKVIFPSTTGTHNHNYGLYAFTKALGEEICEYFWRAHQVKYVALRPGGFIPWTNFVDYGRRLVALFVDRRDVLEAFRCAVENDTVTNDWFFVMPESPFTDEDIEHWDKDPYGVMERRFPTHGHLVKKYNMELNWKPRKIDIQKTKDALGWSPKYSFATFLERLAELDKAGKVNAETCDYEDVATWDMEEFQI
jgi:nucleoside-diphosphate-sugar epimerase